MNLDALYPHVAPNVMGCPAPVMDHNIRLSAIEFCDKTRWHQEEVFAVRVGATGLYELDPEAGLEVLRIASVSVNGKPFDVKTKTAGLRLIAAESIERFFVVLDALQIHINPAPVATDTVQVLAALRPTMTATTLSSYLDEWREGIAGGAIARIAALPKQVFTDPDLAAYQRSIFRDSVQSALVKQGFGSSEATPSRQIQTF